MDSSSISADSSGNSTTNSHDPSAASKIGLARYHYARSSSVDDVLSTSTPHASPLLQSRFRRLNPFSRSTPRLNVVTDRISRSKTRAHDVNTNAQNVLQTSRSAHNVSAVNVSFESEENSKPRRKHVIKELFQRHRKTSLSASAFSKTHYDVQAVRNVGCVRNASDSTFASAVTPSPLSYAKTSRSTPKLNMCDLQKYTPASSGKAELNVNNAKNQALCGTPDIGASSSAACQTYNDALHSASFQNFFSKKVKSNLKRTKSATKLDRRKAPPVTPSTGEVPSTVMAPEADG